ncbi:DUF3426 domain-containing protein [Xanthomonas arboricola]|uniref:DUF3426 domain-containing protein n=1 Tax=Xanthomonas arboricola pv. guizotiae TaxID=487867 RepID=A0A2S7A566_9XANT|nr:DUF3426 domain-containing protein [Xanthomonas arboricola]PPU02241.1 hypothetical protein XarbCFBP7409_05660 [Xanthomonas arboricola pv. guizotiae]PPU24182.1 hypothetical protein XarbCFBP7408_09360 [Xanthomonas arboricola pv. guizotiae]
MSETPPPRRPLATFLRATPAAPSLVPTPVVPAAEAPLHAPPVPAGALVPAPSAPIVPPPPAPPATASHNDSAPVDILLPPGDAGQAAADTAEPDRPAWTTAATRQLPGDPLQGIAAGPGDTHVALAGTPAAQPATAHPRGVAAAGVAGTDRQRAHGTASAPASDLAAPPAPGSAPDTDAEPGDDDADTAGAAAPAQFQPLPAQAAPAFARHGLSRPRLRASGRQWALLVGLVGLLALQIVIADRAQLAADARWRPLVSAACTVARCTLPAWREPGALSLLNREVRPLPGVPGVLQIQASFRNEARWAQAWPWLQLSLSDADGRVIGTRVLAPQEYLGQPPAAQDTLAPGQAVQVAFRVREPAASTAAFSFDFR